MLNKALEAFGDLGDDEELGPADWPTVKRYITSLSHVEGEPLHPHNAFESDQNVHSMNVRDIRMRLLNGKVSLCLLHLALLVYLFINFAMCKIKIFWHFLDLTMLTLKMSFFFL